MFSCKKETLLETKNSRQCSSHYFCAYLPTKQNIMSEQVWYNYQPANTQKLDFAKHGKFKTLQFLTPDYQFHRNCGTQQFDFTFVEQELHLKLTKNTIQINLSLQQCNRFALNWPLLFEVMDHENGNDFIIPTFFFTYLFRIIIT